MSEQEKNLSEAAEAAETAEASAPEEEKKEAKKAESSSSKKAAKKGKDKKKGFVQWVKDIRGEAKKIVWPTREHTFKNTVDVIAMSLILGAFIWIFDGVAITAVKTLISTLG
jgi:preprotein translocase subunit SecE